MPPELAVVAEEHRLHSAKEARYYSKAYPAAAGTAAPFYSCEGRREPSPDCAGSLLTEQLEGLELGHSDLSQAAQEASASIAAAAETLQLANTKPAALLHALAGQQQRLWLYLDRKASAADKFASYAACHQRLHQLLHSLCTCHT